MNPKDNPDAEKLADVAQITSTIYQMASGTSNHIATGGMQTKIQAAEKATENGIATYILSGEDAQALEQFAQGINVGTHFHAQQAPFKAKKHWLKHTLKSTGHVLLDAGAIKAVTQKGASLLPSGIASIEGSFAAGDSIDIIDVASKSIVAKGISQYSHRDLAKIVGQNSNQIATILGYCPSKVAVHRDDMVILQPATETNTKAETTNASSEQNKS